MIAIDIPTTKHTIISTNVLTVRAGFARIFDIKYMLTRRSLCSSAVCVCAGGGGVRVQAHVSGVAVSAASQGLHYTSQ